MALTRLGLQIPSFTYPDTPPDRLFEKIAAIATTAEDSGFDSVWVMDHFYQLPHGVGPETDEMLEAYTLLGGIAARTRKALLGTMVTGVTYRNPAYLAKIISTLDTVSAGRAILGIGAGWNISEHEGYGYDFPSDGERLDRLEEALQICKAMFTEDRPSFEGKHYRIVNALNNPRPLRENGPPIMIGGGGERRTLKLVAQYGDASNIFGNPEQVRHKVGVIAKHCEDIGRDPAEITKTRLGSVIIAPTAEKAAELSEEVRQRFDAPKELWADRVIAGNPDQVLEQAQALVDAGLDGLLFNTPFAYDLDSIQLLGETLRQLKFSS
ncbi:LLM class F420-dependent oxidoreductase [Tenggerimyces flavus]|uniref:TIGR03560 family F420-dependent LLM class oxidoreductase n=1 Tax=Tenggerimyces flavus TaxID=1708749 RepID=A0ABV7YGU5_9ACTN|nr:LLM class F420-dependent oxidoreductase [Tenggerimyces flavus]MBM7784164.1 F420-dependent oxidoreductase-like protein [Tenggerimyces flavus]